jgi:lipopolysaccharide/colanic/teichoic acid biosynthesis glycosyltransferase
MPIEDGFKKPLKASRCKRLLERALAVLLICVEAPAMVLIALAVKLDGGPLLYASRPIGLDGRSVRCLEFRSTVVPNADQDDEAHQERLTPVGNFLRAFSLHELPLLFSVVAGTMSLVGPPPALSLRVPAHCFARRPLFHPHRKPPKSYCPTCSRRIALKKPWGTLRRVTGLNYNGTALTSRAGGIEFR